VDIELLKYFINRFDKTQKNLAKAMGISTSRLNAKINNYRGAEFTEPEMRFIKERYELDNDEFNRIFFNDLVSEKDTR
jgi:hypothetical protein